MFAAMRPALALVAMLLAGCGDSAKQAALHAEEEYRLVESAETSDANDKCEAMRRVADAWRAALDQSQYEHWKLRSDIQCRSAEQLERLGI